MVSISADIYSLNQKFVEKERIILRALVEVLKLFSVVLKIRADEHLATVAARGLRVPEQCGVAKKYSEIEIFVTVSWTLLVVRGVLRLGLRPYLKPIP